jgi:glycoside/pentoside/hexuronide:cation symporter, GPH family
MGLVIAALIAAGALLAFFGTRRAPVGAAPGREPSLARQLRVARGNRPFRRLLWIVTVQSAATGALLAGVVYVAQHVLADPGATAVLIPAFTLPALLLLPVLAGVGARSDKCTGVLVSSVVFVAAALALLVALVGGLAAVVALAVVLGCANAVQDTFVLAMLPDCIAADTARTGRRQAGVFAGLFSAGQGVGFALGALLFGLVLQLAGYMPSTSGTAAAQPGATALGVLVGFAVLPRGAHRAQPAGRAGPARTCTRGGHTRIDGTVALVTGAGRGIGRAFAPVLCGQRRRRDRQRALGPGQGADPGVRLGGGVQGGRADHLA